MKKTINIEIEQQDLKGQIANFPIEVVQKMVENQVEQGNPANVSIFQRDALSSKLTGGFDWDVSEEGNKFWKQVIVEKNFRLFFVEYPKTVYIKTSSKVYGRDIIYTLEKYGGINKNEYIGDTKNCIYYINYNNVIEICELKGINAQLCNLIENTYTEINVEKQIVEITIEEIAKMMGVEPSNIRIKK